MELVCGSIAPTARSMRVGVNQCHSRDSASPSMPRCQSGFWEPIGWPHKSDVASYKSACVSRIHPQRWIRETRNPIPKKTGRQLDKSSVSLVDKQPGSFVYIICLSEFSLTLTWKQLPWAQSKCYRNCPLEQKWLERTPMWSWRCKSTTSFPSFGFLLFFFYE